jgi:hypothetical protein
MINAPDATKPKPAHKRVKDVKKTERKRNINLTSSAQCTAKVASAKKFTLF